MSGSADAQVPQGVAGGSWPGRLVAAVAVGAAVSLLLYFPDRNDGSGAVLGGLSALVGVAFGLAALSRCRVLPTRSPLERVRLVPRALVLGVGLGVANLLANYAMAFSNPIIHEQMVTRWARFSPWSVVIAGPITEEIAFRLVLLSVLGWVAARFTDNRRTIFAAALVLSSLLFGVAHIFYGGVDDPLYMIGMAVKSSGGGLLLGWVFWRWGLPYSMVCHSTANGIHLLLMPALF